MAVSANELVELIDERIGKFVSTLPELSQSAFKDIQGLLKQLKLDSSGNIKISVENLRLINKIKSRVENSILTDAYYQNISEIKESFADITTLQTDYFSKAFDAFDRPKVIAELQKVSINSTVESLSESAINENVIGGVGEILERNITSGSSFLDLNKQLTDFMVGSDKIDPKLMSYSRQIMTDSLSQYTANYQKVVTDDLGLKWYQYVGSLTANTSRPLCVALVEKRWVHETEIGDASRGIVDGKNVGKEGMIPNTTKSNFQVFRGGYNCNHLLVPVAEEAVPKEVRISLYKKKNIEYDGKGLAVK